MVHTSGFSRWNDARYSKYVEIPTHLFAEPIKLSSKLRALKKTCVGHTTELKNINVVPDEQTNYHDVDVCIFMIVHISKSNQFIE